MMKKYNWEVTHITSVVVVITTLTLVLRLTGTARVETPASGNIAPIAPSSTSFPSFVTAQSAPTALPIQASSQDRAARTEQSDPRVIVVGPRDIGNRYTLLRVDRKPISATSDELRVRLHVESLAMEPLVSPFESDMLDISSPDLAPVVPKTPFRHPVPGGNSLNQDVVFRIPNSLSLNHTTLRIHYYNYQNEIPLSLPPRDNVE